MSYDPKNYPAESGRYIDEDGTIKNIVTVLGGGTPISEAVYNPDDHPAHSARVIGEDGRLYNILELLRNAGGGDAIPPHNHDERYYTRAEIDNAGYLLANPDNETVEVQGGELRAKSLSGLQLAVSQLNAWLAGTEGNIQSQINDILLTLAALSAGMRYLGKFETKADLQGVTTMDNGDLAVVLADETRSGARSMYVYNEDLGLWDFIGAFEFADAFTSLTDTPNAFDNGKLLRSGINGLYFDTPKWGEIDGRPDRTKAQIEGAVDAAHTHAKTDAQITAAVDAAHSHTNKAILDRIGIDEQGRITIDGVPYVPVTEAKQRLYARRTGSEQSLSAGTDCVFNTKYSGDISYSTSTGVFTLAAGKTYRIMVTASINTTGYVILQLVEADTNAVTSDSNRSIWMDVNLVSSSWHESSAGPLLAYVTPTVTKGYKIRAISVNGTAGLRQNFSALEIMEV